MYTVYVSNQFSGRVASYSLSVSDAKLREIDSCEIGGVIMPMAVSLNNQSLFVVRRSDPYTVFSFDTSSDARLTLKGQTRALSGYVQISVDRSGRYLLGVSHADHFIALHPIEEGVVQPAVLVRSAGSFPHGAEFDPSNRFVLVTSLGDDRVLEFAFDAETGGLNQVDKFALSFDRGFEPRHLKINRTGAAVFVLGETSGVLERLRLDPVIGVMHRLDSISVTSDTKAAFSSVADLAICEDLDVVYVSDRASNQIICVKHDEEAGGFAIAGRFATAPEPRSIAIDPDGEFLLATGQYTKSITIFKIDRASGLLSRCGVSEGHDGPAWIEITRHRSTA